MKTHSYLALELLRALMSALGGLLGWAIIAPLAVLIPKQRNWIVVIGRQHGKFLDNAKQFYLQTDMVGEELRLTFLTELEQTLEQFRTCKQQALKYPSLSAFWCLLRCNVVVADSTEWYRHFRRFFLLRAHVIQLWHGVPLKRIEIDKWRHETGQYRIFSSPLAFYLRMFVYRVSGRLIRYSLVTATSHFYCETSFREAFLSKEFLVVGYPRNAFTLDWNRTGLAWCNVDSSIRAQLDDWILANRKLVIVAPTMRDSGSTPMRLDRHALDSLDRFCDAHNVEMIFKFHPSQPAASQIGGEHLHVCDPSSDLYPLLPLTHAMVTDYSSIYVDYLLVDKPILFLVPDLEEYIRVDRELRFDFDAMTPGSKVTTWAALTEQLLLQWTDDTYTEARAELRLKAFSNLSQEMAVPTLIKFMRDQGWLPEVTSSK